MRFRVRSIAILLALPLALVACAGQEPPEPVEPSAERSLPPARTLPLPVPDGDPGPPSGERKFLAWDMPAGWQALEPSSSMRLAQYRASGPEGDGECVVFYFGPGQGGDPLSNAARWAGQFQQPDGRDPRDAMSVTALDGTRLPVHLVEISGTYDGGMTMTDAPARQLAGYRLLGAIVEGPDAPWFFKFTGPAATIEAQREAFIAMMRSLRVEEG
jgi:hypothetical protein